MPDPITQDSCAFYEHHDVFKQYSGLVLETSEGDEIAKLLSNKKALILQNHGLLTVGVLLNQQHGGSLLWKEVVRHN